MEENIAIVETLEFGNPKEWAPYITPTCSNCKHASTRRGVYPFHICALDGQGRWKDCFCENFAPSKEAEWLAWE